VSDKGDAASILIVEDDQPVRSALAAYLARIGHEVLQAENGEEALQQLATHRLAAMLCDIRMPKMTGLELLPLALASDPDLAIIMLTGVDDPSSAIACLKLGAADYLFKPLDLEELKHALHSALHKRQLEIERRETEQWLAREVALRTHELDKQFQQLKRLAVSVLAALVDALEAKDAALRGHSRRVADLSARIGARLGLGADDVEAVRVAGRLHDIGKLALREPGFELATAASAEISTAQGDPDLALRLLVPLVHIKGVAEIVRYQHERYDGKGVPGGPCGEEIPLGSRIVAAASLYDERAAGGGEGKATEPRRAVASLRALVGLILDPEVFAALEQEVTGTA
jgi:putative two-component system response regulator